MNAFNDVHLNVGWSGEEYNPLRFRLVQFTDGIAPSIAAAGVRLFDEAWVAAESGQARTDAWPWTQAASHEASAAGASRRARTRSHRRGCVGPGGWQQGVSAPRPLCHRVQRDHNRGARSPSGALANAAAVGTSNAERRTPSPAAAANDALPTSHVPPLLTQVFDRIRREADAAKRVYATGSGIPVYGASRTQFLYVATTLFTTASRPKDSGTRRLSTPGEHVCGCS